MNTLNVNQAAELLKMSPLTLRKAAAAGKVPGSKPFKAWVFVADELLAFIKSKRPCIYIDGKTLRTGGSVSGLRVVKSGSQLAREINAKRKNLQRTPLTPPGVSAS